MTDDDLDRRLHEAMRATPSVDLAARVRARVADEPAPAPAWRWWPALAGGVAVAAAFVVFLGREAPPPANDTLAGTPRASAAASAQIGEAVVPPAVAVPDIGPTPASVAGSRTRRAEPEPRAAMSTTMADTRQPALLLAPGDAEAFRVLLAFSRAAIGADSSSDSVAQVTALQMSPIDIVPLEVTPLAIVDDVPEGDPR